MSRLQGIFTSLLLLNFLSTAADAESVPDAVKRLHDKKKDVRLEALRHLGKQGIAAKEAVGEIASLLRESEDAETVSQAAATLAQIGPAATPALARFLKDGRGEHARQAAAALAKMGPAAKDAQDALVAALKDPDPAVRRFAAIALGQLEERPEEVTEALFQMVADPVLEVRKQAGIALLRGGPHAVNYLKATLRDGKGAARVEAAGLLGWMGQDAADALSELQAAFEDAQPELRATSARALGNLKGKAKEALPLLMNGLAKEKLYPVQHDIFQAVTAIGERDVPGFLDEMARINREGNWAAPFVLARFGPRAVDSVKPLIKLLKDPDPGMRMAVALALAQVGPDAAEALPHLQMLLKDAQPQVRGAAAQAIYHVDPRFEEMARKPFDDAMKQADQALKRVQAHLAKTAAIRNSKFRTLEQPFDRRAFQDPGLQAQLRLLMDLHLYASTSQNRRTKLFDAETRAKLDTLQLDAGGALDELGPEAIPAFVYGINQAAAFRLGFC